MVRILNPCVCVCVLLCFIDLKVKKIRNEASCLYACMLGFCRTLEIIVRTLHEVVNRERLCGTTARLFVLCCFSCLCPFIALSLGISSHSEDHRENATRSGKQSEIGRSARPKGFTR